MKICGYCNNEYDDKETKCPVCRSTILKNTKNTASAKAEYERIEQEIKNKRKKRSMILGVGVGVIAISVVVIIISIVSFINNPQRAIDKEAKEKYDSAVGYISQEEYDLAIKALDEIDTSWSDYDKVAGKRTEAVKGQLTSTLTQYESTGDYESVISYINENVDDINVDAEIKQIYDNSVAQYKSAAITTADGYVSNGDYSAATSVLTTAIRVIGSDSELEKKMSEVGKAGILAEVKEYKNNGNYAEAIQYVNDNMDIVGNDSEILIELSSCEDAYRNAVIAEAAEVYQNSGYQAAVSLIDEALLIMRDDQELMNKRMEYVEKAPIQLGSLSPISSSIFNWGNAGNDSEILQDTYGNNYSASSTAVLYGAMWLEGDSYHFAEYYVGGTYKKLQGTIAVSTESYDCTASLCISVDGKIIYEDNNITRKTKPISIDLDILGKEYIEIEVEESSLVILLSDFELIP